MARTPNLKEREQWRKVVAKQAKSGLTVAEFCEQEGISTSVFYWRRRVVKETKAVEAPETSVKSKDAGSGSRRRRTSVEAAVNPSETMVIELPTGVRFELPTENLDLVRAVVEAVVRGDYPPTGVGKK